MVDLEKAKEVEKEVINKAQELLDLIEEYRKVRVVIPIEYRILRMELIKFLLLVKDEQSD